MHVLLVLSSRLALTQGTAAFARFFSRQEEGASLVEYALILGLIAVVCIGAITLLGEEISSLFSRLADQSESVAPDENNAKGKGKGKGLGLSDQGRAPAEALPNAARVIAV